MLYLLVGIPSNRDMYRGFPPAKSTDRAVVQWSFDAANASDVGEAVFTRQDRGRWFEAEARQ